jgi:hypothetical protein
VAAPTPDTDALFQLPPAEFTAARNALAAKLRKSGKSAEAERVKTLAKPSISAWAVNQLFWKHRKAWDRLIASGEKFKQAQVAQFAGKSADLRGPLDARREALAELTTIASSVLRDAGNSATPDVMRRVTTTLEALATYGSHPDAPPAGRLSDDVDPPGFEALAALIPQVGRGKKAAHEPPTRVIPFQQKKRDPRVATGRGSTEEDVRRRDEARKAEVAAAREALAEAERRLREARGAAEDAQAALKKVATRAKETEREKAELEKQFEKVSAEFEAARREARKVASDAEDAAQAVADAERAVEKARSEVEKVT